MYKTLINKFLLLICVLLLVIFSTSCSVDQNDGSIIDELQVTKNNCIETLDIHIESLRTSENEYAFILIESITEKAKQAILEENEETEIISILEATINDINNIFLKDEEKDVIKNIFIEEFIVRNKEYYDDLNDYLKKQGIVDSSTELDIEESLKDQPFNILYMLEKCNDKYVLIIEGDVRLGISLAWAIRDHYFIYCKSIGKILTFMYLPEPICVVYNNVYYNLCDAYDLGIISDEELIDIAKNFSKINGTGGFDENFL